MGVFGIVRLMSSVAFTLAVAYVVYILANKEKKGLKELGKVLAYILVILAVVTYFGKTFYMGGHMKMMGKGMYKCPMMQKR